MLEVDVVAEPVDSPPEVVVARQRSSSRGSDSTTTPPPTTDDPASPTVKPSPDDDITRPPLRGWPQTVVNNNCVRYPSVKPSEVGLELPASVGRTTEVATALAGVHAVLDCVDSVAERQQVLGDVIVHLQVLRCRLQLAQVIN